VPRVEWAISARNDTQPLHRWSGSDRPGTEVGRGTLRISSAPFRAFVGVSMQSARNVADCPVLTLSEFNHSYLKYPG
jgi:hypothetical protein